MIRAGVLFGLVLLGCSTAGPVELPEPYFCPQAIGASCGPPASGVQIVEAEPEAEPVDPHDAKAGRVWRDLAAGAGAPAVASLPHAPACCSQLYHGQCEVEVEGPARGSLRVVVVEVCASDAHHAWIVVHDEEQAEWPDAVIRGRGCSATPCSTSEARQHTDCGGGDC